MPYSVYPLGPLETNSYLVHKDGQAVVIDAGGDPAPSCTTCAPRA